MHEIDYPLDAARAQAFEDHGGKYGLRMADIVSANGAEVDCRIEFGGTGARMVGKGWGKAPERHRVPTTERGWRIDPDFWTAEYIDRTVLKFRKGKITQWGWSSRTNFMLRMSGIVWEAIDRPLWEVTLTYPALFPMDGKEAVRNIKAFHKSVDEELEGVQAIWKREFQHRGAPHYHMMMAVGEASADLARVTDVIERTWRRVVRDWIEKTYHLEPEYWDVLQEKWDRFYKRKATVAPIRHYRRCQMYLGAYLTADKGKAQKEAQHKPPADFVNLGRFWGELGRDRELFPKEHGELGLTLEQGIRFRRLVRRRLKKGGKGWRRLGTSAIFTTREGLRDALLYSVWPCGSFPEGDYRRSSEYVLSEVDRVLAALSASGAETCVPQWLRKLSGWQTLGTLSEEVDTGELVGSDQAGVDVDADVMPGTVAPEAVRRNTVELGELGGAVVDQIAESVGVHAYSIERQGNLFESSGVDRGPPG